MLRAMTGAFSNLRVRKPSALALAGALALLTLLASLLALRRLHARQQALLARDYHAAVESQARRLAEHLARAAPPATPTPDWSAFADQVRWLYAAGIRLQVVSITRGESPLFHAQARPDTSPSPLLVTGVFERASGSADLPWQVRLTLVAEPDAPQAAARQALRSMLSLILAALGAALAACAALLVWGLRREAARARQRRNEEHLAFAGILANGIVHDFRNPMSALRLDAQLLGRETARGADARPERLRALGERITATLDRMDKVFLEFLYLSKPHTAPEIVDLCDCVRDALDLLSTRFDQAGVRADLALPPQPVRVRAAPHALRRALVNVMVNAEQVSPRGAAVAIRVAAGPRAAVVEVLDHGPGIPRAERRKLFEMFHTTRPGGTGLGLFLARTSLATFGGTIALGEAPAGWSTCFRLTVPLCKETDTP